MYLLDLVSVQPHYIKLDGLVVDFFAGGGGGGVGAIFKTFFRGVYEPYR